MRLEGTEAFSPTGALRLLRRLTSGRHVGSAAGRGALFAVGVSGELPLVTADTRDLGEVRELTLSHRFLAYGGFCFDLVFHVPEEGYDRPVYAAVLRTVRECGCEGELSARGGLHTAPPGAQREPGLSGGFGCG